MFNPDQPRAKDGEWTSGGGGGGARAVGSNTGITPTHNLVSAVAPKKSDVTDHIRALGNVTAKYDSSTKEWEIKLKGDKEGRSSYFTDDHADAMATATRMSLQAKGLSSDAGNKAQEDGMAIMQRQIAEARSKSPAALQADRLWRQQDAEAADYKARYGNSVRRI